MVNAMLRQTFERHRLRGRPILNFDQGWQYRTVNLSSRSKHAVKPIMARRGNCYENAVMESFFGTLKSEIFYLNKFNNLDGLEAGRPGYKHYCNRHKSG